MTAGEKLITLSNLSGCQPASLHFCSIFAGGNKIVSGTYDVQYIPTEKSKMKYTLPNKIPIQYIAKTSIGVEYIKTPKEAMKYIAAPTIKIVHKCKP